MRNWKAPPLLVFVGGAACTEISWINLVKLLSWNLDLRWVMTTKRITFPVSAISSLDKPRTPNKGGLGSSLLKEGSNATATSREVGGKGKTPDHPPGVLPQYQGGTKRNRIANLCGAQG
ncbi:hypothetical protein TNCV_29671 [Trichonephila clavipes]|nr:hypothetical protein TNCV_29671 [Trichonephila clavipes]